MAPPKNVFALIFALLALDLARAEGEEAALLEEAPVFCISDRGGVPVAGARVSVFGRTATFETDEKGCFRIEPEPRPPFEITVFDPRGAWLGLIRVTRLTEESDRRLTLPRAAHEEVTVRGGVPTTTRAPPAAAATVVSRSEIEESRPRRLEDALADLPGLGHLDEGHTSVPSLRGLARGRTLILVDGARVTAERRAGPSGGYLNPLALESVEIARGPGSVAYGSDALGGVIHAATPLPRAGDFGGRLFLGAASADKSAGGLAEVNVPLGRGALLLQAQQRYFADYESPRGRIENSGARGRGALARALLPLGRSRLLLGAQLDEGRDTGKPASDSENVLTSYPREDSHRFTLGIEFAPPAGLTQLEVQAFLGRYRLITQRDRRATPSLPRQVARADVDANDASLRLVAARSNASGLLRFGLDSHGRLGLEALGTSVAYDAAGNEARREREVLIKSSRRMDAGIFAEAERSVVNDRLSLAAGLRGDRVTTRNSGGFFGDRSASRGALSGYASATFLFKKEHGVTLQYARGFRGPALSDLYFRGVSGRGFVTGNPDLGPETSDQYDLAIRTSLGSSTRVAVYGYLYRICDLIERYPAGADFAFRNRGEEELAGIEVESDLDLTPSLTARVTFSSVRGEILDDGSHPADVPPTALALSLNHRVHERFWWRGRLLLVARDGEPGPTEKETPGYGVLDLAAGYRVTKGLEAGLLLSNLTDKTHPDSPDEKAVLAPGRSVTFTLGQKF